MSDLTRMLAVILTFTLSATAQVISKGGIVNVANYEPRLASHTVAAIYGEDLATEVCSAESLPLPTELCGTTVIIRDSFGRSIAAPLFYVSPGQINIQVPLVAIGSVDVCIKKNCEFAVVNRLEPAILEYEREPGEFDPVITHLDGSVVTPENPAENGEWLVMFAIGMSHEPTFPPDGAPAPADPPIEFTSPSFPLRVDSQLVPVSFAGLAPGFVGLAQFNFKLESTVRNTKFPPGRVPVWIQDDDGFIRSKVVLLHVKDEDLR